MFVNEYIDTARGTSGWGEFVSDFSDTAGLSRTRASFQSAYRHNYLSCLGKNSVFDEYALLMSGTEFPAEDQCSEKYYFDVFHHFLRHFGETKHVVEVGCYAGGSTCWLYVASRLFGFTLDVVDANPNSLLYARARLQATFGEIGDNVRFFYGDVPAYVERIASRESRKATSIHHDGAHSFNECVQDFASLSFVSEDLLHLIVQDTNLRSEDIHKYIFVDSAMHAVFGDYAFRPIGLQLNEPGAPAWNARIFFDSRRSEGQIVDMREVGFRYPHPETSKDVFFEALRAAPEPVAVAS